MTRHEDYDFARRPPFKIISTCFGGGYQYAKTFPPHPKNNVKGLYPLHRVLMENRIGRLLANDEVVHHVDGNRYNNHIENLEVLNNVMHVKLHATIRGKQAQKRCTCEYCHKVFYTLNGEYQKRTKRNKSKQIFCSPTCGAMRYVPC